jgi:hypothetical protein
MVAVLGAHDASESLWDAIAESVRDKRVIDRDWNSPTHYLKHFVAGALSVVAMTGLDQDMMQRTLSCRTERDARNNVIVSGVLQLGVIAMLLTLGAIMMRWAQTMGVALPEAGDELFPAVAVGGGLSVVAGVMFVLGLAASSFSSAGSSLTALTTSFTLDILGGKARFAESLTRVRWGVHTAMAVVVGVIIVAIHGAGTMSAIDVVFRLAAYTYGPLLGLFAFGIFTRRKPNPRVLPVLAVVAPVLSFVVAVVAPQLLGGYRFGHDILFVNATFMFLGLAFFSQKK